MKRDTIFRIASITKPVTAVAAMILVEDCKLRLDDSIEPWLPELANRRVLKSLSSELDDTVPARRAITLRDLLIYRIGFGSVMAQAGTYPIQKWIREYRIGGDGPALPSDAPGMDEWLRRLGSILHARKDISSAHCRDRDRRTAGLDNSPRKKLGRCQPACLSRWKDSRVYATDGIRGSRCLRHACRRRPGAPSDIRWPGETGYGLDSGRTRDHRRHSLRR